MARKNVQTTAAAGARSAGKLSAPALGCQRGAITVAHVEGATRVKHSLAPMSCSALPHIRKKCPWALRADFSRLAPPQLWRMSVERTVQLVL